MLKEYEWNGLTFQFEEGRQPEGAKPVERKSKSAPKDKSRNPSADKGRE